MFERPKIRFKQIHKQNRMISNVPTSHTNAQCCLRQVSFAVLRMIVVHVGATYKHITANMRRGGENVNEEKQGWGTYQEAQPSSG
jgi:hypothetical protein